MKIKIFANPKKKWANKISGQLASLIYKNGHEIVYQKADVTICIGGDGTILFANHIGDLQGKILGIGGEKSMICQLNKDNWKSKIVKLLEKIKNEKRLILRVLANRREYTSINDIVVHSKDYRIIEIFVEIDGKKHFFEGDGLIISTPIGSAAYAYSAGGKKLKKSARKFEIVPIAPYKRAFKPIIVDEKTNVKIYCDRESAFIIDGIFIRNLRPEERITITKGEYIEFVKK